MPTACGGAMQSAVANLQALSGTKRPQRIKEEWYMNRRIVIFGLTLLAVLALLGATVVADNPHTIYVRVSGTDVCFKIAGMGDNEWFTITATADATAEYWCQNGGGNYPQDPKKQQVQGPVSNSGLFESGKNGHITGCLPMPAPEPVPFCPPGQHEVLQWYTLENPSVSW